MSKRALITGITGQDGSYLAELLLEKGYEVHGIKRRASSLNTQRVDHIYEDPHTTNQQFELHYGDLSDSLNLTRIVQQIQPDEVYNLGAQSHVAVSFESPEYTADIDAMGTLRLLEAIRIVNPKVKFYQASTSEMFGKVQQVPQTEDTDFYPRSPYGVAKLYAHWMTINYRESYDIFGTSGILFNHESPLRGQEFVTRKITDTVAKIVQGKASELRLGNMNAKRDWGYAKDYVAGMWAMMQADAPDTYVLATNRTETVRSFVEMAFKAVDIEIAWKGQDEDEVGYNAKTNDKLIVIDKAFYRPSEVELLIGDAAKAKAHLGWEATTNLEELCALMVKADLERNETGASF